MRCGPFGQTKVAVRLALLGGFDLRQPDGVAIDLPGQKDRALLAFLASPPGAAHPRDKLASLLWGEHGEAGGSKPRADASSR